MEKKVKKKARASQKDKWVPSDSRKKVAEPSNPRVKDDGVSVAKVRKACPHIDKGVDLNKLQAKIGSSAVIRCEDCKEGAIVRKGGNRKGKHAKKKGRANSKSESKSVWLCLECGHYACGGVGLPITPLSHAVRHASQTRHALVVQFENPQLRWCFQCSTLITIDKTGENGEEKDVFSDVVKLIKGHSSEDSSGDVKDVWFGSGSVTRKIKLARNTSSLLDGRGGYVVTSKIKSASNTSSLLDGRGGYVVRRLANLDCGVTSQPIQLRDHHFSLEEDHSNGEDIGANALLSKSAVGVGLHEGNHNEQDGSVLLGIGGTALEPHLPKIALGGNSVSVSNSIGGGTLSCDASICSLASNLDKSKKGSIIDLEMRLKKFIACFDTEDCLSVTIDDIAHPLSGIQSSFEGGKVPSEFVIPLTKFVEKYDGGSFSSLFAEGKSARQKQILIKELGSVLYSMEVEEVKTEEIFLVWRDACRDIINWGLNVNFMLDHLKQAARNFFGYMLRPTGSENCCREIHQLEKDVFKLRNKLSHLEQQLGKAQEDLRTRLGDAIGSDSMVCMLESSWTPPSRAIHDLY